MATGIATPLQYPRASDGAQELLYKLAAIHFAAADGALGFLIRGNVNASPKPAVSATPTGITAGVAASQQLLAANANRTAFIVDNRTGADIFYRYGGTAATTAVGGYSVRVPSGTQSATDTSWTGAVQVIGTANGSGINVTEYASV